MKVLFLLIAYNNEEEVVSFLRQLDKINEVSEHSIDVVITDNYGNFDPQSLSNIQLKSTVLHPDSNLGYLKGCAYGLNHYLVNHSLPAWVSISNTDLDLPIDYLGMLDGVAENVGQLSPFVVKSNGIKQNPHLTSRPRNSYYWKQKLIHCNSFVGALYIWLSGRSKKKSDKIEELSNLNLDQDIEIFCAHGSIFFLSQRFFTLGGSIENGPFLYGEEIYIGQQLHKLNLGSVCRLRFSVTHNAHGTSKFVSLRNKSKLFRSSFELLHKKSKTADV